MLFKLSYGCSNASGFGPQSNTSRTASPCPRFFLQIYYEPTTTGSGNTTRALLPVKLLQEGRFRITTGAVTQPWDFLRGRHHRRI